MSLVDEASNYWKFQKPAGLPRRADADFLAATCCDVVGQLLCEQVLLYLPT
ncbi:hypothetical protein KO481_20265 [Nocardia sp. NEAU-G5]|uniref:Uncharacterized protein n=1 Tax=Nocardia albiluteola TaxID=2842303 RepID=A0ABS6B284_9NOCA|nr:hypothetical protein [Nocardia albiluteola]MBU3063856.1 hypothetical protein [Nocardia albiluteola]